MESTSSSVHDTLPAALSSLLQLLFAGEHLQESFPVLQQVFLASLKDSSVEVRRTALEAVSAMMPWLDDEHHIALFKDLVPLTIQV